MRSPQEIFFRLRQESANLWLFATQPSIETGPQTPLTGLPDPAPVLEALRGTKFHRDVEQIASQVLAHQLPAMGGTVRAAEVIDWRSDHQGGPVSALRYFRSVPYMDYQRVGDYRLIWEFNRHQYLVALAQAYSLSGNREYWTEIAAQLESWWTANPWLRGINWTSALEAAFRALSWIWIYHLCGNEMPPPFRRRFLTELYRHGLFLEYNISIYFSPNTHLQGEAVALHALGVLFPQFPHSQRWREFGGRIVAEQMGVQVREDGSHFEQATYYHIYALDFFLFHSLLAETSPEYRDRLHRMAEYLAAIMGPAQAIPMIGDDDGGRLFHPFGKRDEFGRATLATCGILFNRPEWVTSLDDVYCQAAWWLGPKALAQHRPGDFSAVCSRHFAGSGLTIFGHDDVHILMDNGPFGWGSGGHSHCDTLSLVVRAGSEQILIDPGTYTYVLEDWRNRMRGSAAHNTARVDGRDQARPNRAFSWRDRPEVEVLAASFTADRDLVVAECRYDGIIHRRRVLLWKPGLIFVVDEIEGPVGDHECEVFWHPGEPIEPLSDRCWRIGSRARLCVAGGEAERSEGGDYGWRSACLSQKAPAPLIRVHKRAPVPAYLAAVIDLRGSEEVPALQLNCEQQVIVCTYAAGGSAIKVLFHAGGSTRVEATIL